MATKKSNRVQTLLRHYSESVRRDYRSNAVIAEACMDRRSHDAASDVTDGRTNIGLCL